MARLARLSEQPLEDPLATRAYYIELSDLLRHYLARRLHVNAMESTTGELVREMTRKKIVANEWVQQVRVVLELADFVKFAHGQPPTARSRAAVDEARHAIDGIEAIVRRREAAAAAPTEPAPAAGARVPEPS